jgi:hypothetical protein
MLREMLIEEIERLEMLASYSKDDQKRFDITSGLNWYYCGKAGAFELTAEKLRKLITEFDSKLPPWELTKIELHKFEKRV